MCISDLIIYLLATLSQFTSCDENSVLYRADSLSCKYTDISHGNFLQTGVDLNVSFSVVDLTTLSVICVIIRNYSSLKLVTRHIPTGNIPSPFSLSVINRDN